MLNSIQQKLSAIKAINEEKDNVDHELSILNGLHADTNNVSISFNMTLGEVDTNASITLGATFIVNTTLANHLIALVKQDRHQRHIELIAKAEQLMK